MYHVCVSLAFILLITIIIPTSDPQWHSSSRRSSSSTTYEQSILSIHFIFASTSPIEICHLLPLTAQDKRTLIQDFRFDATLTPLQYVTNNQQAQGRISRARHAHDNSLCPKKPAPSQSSSNRSHNKEQQTGVYLPRLPMNEIHAIPLYMGA